MEIQKVAIVGLGALGVMFGQKMAQNSPPGSVVFVADDARAARYKAEGVYVNGARQDFCFVPPTHGGPPADLLIFAVKAGALQNAIADAAQQVGPNTVVLSLLNGISSEEIIGEAYGAEKVLYCVAQGMDVGKSGNEVEYQNMGRLVLGEKDNQNSGRLKAVRAYFEKVGIPTEQPPDIIRHMWSKFMLNVGINQTTVVYGTDYGGAYEAGEAHEAMLAAMREALAIAQKAGVALTETDIDYWMGVLGTLAPRGIPSMKQDTLAKRKTEVELFAGTVRRLGKQYGVPTPVNDRYYEVIAAMEKAYGA